MAELAHENVFRALNERIRLLATTFRAFDEETIPFICECASDRCFAPVELSLADYDELCAADRRVLVLGHPAELPARAEAV